MENKEVQYSVKDAPDEKNRTFNPMSLMPQKFSEKLTMATVLCKSGLLPSGLNTPEKIVVALEYGHELQLSPMIAVNNIAVVNGKPTLSADIMLAIAKRSPEYAGIEWKKKTEDAAECVISRKTHGFVEKTTGYFDLAMAKNAGLTDKDNWKKYRGRMIMHRALSFALRDAFPDLLAGIYSTDEIEEVVDHPPKIVPQTQEAKDDAIDVTGEKNQETENTESVKTSEIPASEPEKSDKEDDKKGKMSDLTEEIKSELKTMFDAQRPDGSYYLSDEEHQQIWDDFKSGKITANDMIWNVRKLYTSRTKQSMSAASAAENK